MAKVLDTDTVKRINRKSEEKGRNRILSDNVYDMLDPTGKHVVGLTFPHGPDSDACIRTEILLKFREDNEPHTAFLDMEWEDYTSLQEVKLTN